MSRCAVAALQWLQRRARSDEGQGLAEYGLILVLISVVAVAVMNSIGQDAIALFADAADSVADALD